MDWEGTAPATIPQSDREGLNAHYELEGGFSDSSGHYRHGRIMRGEPLFSANKAGQGASFDVDTHVAFPGTRDLDLSSPFTIAFWMRRSGLVEIGVLSKLDGPDTQRGLALSLSRPVSIPDTLRREYDLTVRLSSGPSEAIVVKPENRLVDAKGSDSAYHVAISYDGSGRAEGVRFYLNGQSVQAAILQDTLAGSPKTDAPLEIGAVRFGNRYTGTLDDLRIYSRTLDNATIEAIHTHEPIRSMLGDPYIDCVPGARQRSTEARRRHLRAADGHQGLALPQP